MKTTSSINKCLGIFCIILFTQNITAQNQKEFNGWEFLEWNLDMKSAEKILEAKKDLLAPPHATDANFNYREMNTWLYYNDQSKLNKVKQRLTFSVNRQKDANEFFEKTKSRLIKTYGRPDKQEINKKDSVINFDWKLKFTKIHLNYDYKYKIIDELGASSYWVDVVFEPLKN